MCILRCLFHGDVDDLKWSCQDSASQRRWVCFGGAAGIAHPQHVMSCQKLSCRFHVADVVSCCCMMRTSKQPYPDDDIELVHLERTRFSVKEHESLMGITTPTTG